MRKLWVLVVCGGFACSGVLRAQQVQVSPTNRTIAVTASADAERRADTAVVHIGYLLYGPTSDAVTEQASKTSLAIADAVRNAGVPKEALESESQSTAPVQDYQQNGLNPEERADRKFEAQQSWTVRTGADAAAKVLAVAVAARANQSGAIDWSVADEASLTAEAAAKAMQHAREIAAQMAAGLGAKLGVLLYASNEAEQLRPVPLMERVNATGILGGMGAGAAPKLELGPPMVKRSATVSVIFALQ